MIITNNYCFLRHKKLNNKIQNFPYSRIITIARKILVVLSVYILIGLLFTQVYAKENISNNDINIENNENNIAPYQTQRGSVWLHTDNGVYIEALQLQTDVHYEITGSISRARVKQEFINNSSLWVEGIYVFPLPEKAAVDKFKMIIGDRIIEGEIKKRMIAKQIYQAAKSAGKKASLIEQQRPNVFTTSLANIAPGEAITVEFEFQQVLEYKDESYRLRFPTVVGPRYHTSESLSRQTNSTLNETSVHTETSTERNTLNPIRIHVLLDAGFSLLDLSSSYHPIDIKQTSESRYSISTIGKNIASDRDFELVWKPQLIDTPQLSALYEDPDKNMGGDIYTMLTLLPPDLSHLQQKVQARDIVFVLDISGSMAGTSIDQAKASLIAALNRLTVMDRFNIIWFNNETDSLFPQTVTATTQHKNIAKKYVNKLQAGGGTEMLPAMKLALSGNKEFSRFKQIIFLTDGNISNESQLFDVIDNKLGNNRLFTIGIGSAPNAYFMRKAANKGRGTFTYIGDVNEVHKKTIALFKKLESPALINIQLNLDRDKYEVFPNIIPDLYAGETTNILIRSRHVPENITIRGDYGNSEWQSSGQLKSTSKNGIRIAWAREKISSLMNLQHESNTENERGEIEDIITETALNHHLVSRYTSLVAVDKTPSNISEMLYRQRMKNNLPHGWKTSSTSNGLMLAQTSTGSTLNLLLSLLFFIAALMVYRIFYSRTKPIYTFRRLL